MTRSSAAGVEYLNLAIGPENGPVTLHVPRDFDGRARDPVNRMASLGSNLRSEEEVAVEVPGVRLDDAVPLAAADRMVAWIDVEGALGAVLPGSRETLARAAAIYVEVEAEPIWDGQWLDRDVLEWFDGIGMVPLLRDRQRREQYNVLLVPAVRRRDPRGRGDRAPGSAAGARWLAPISAGGIATRRLDVAGGRSDRRAPAGGDGRRPAGRCRDR